MLILAIAFAGLLFRLPRLELRPLHTDEAVHAVKLGELLESGSYIYNPLEYHGPSLYYFTLPVARLAGVEALSQFVGQSLLLIVPVVFGSLLIAALLMIQSGIGWRACTIAAVLTAISPAMVYYSRYYIQEMLLVAFAFLVIACGWRYTISASTRGRAGYALAAGACAGLMIGSKETALLLLGVMSVSIAAVYLVHRKAIGLPTRGFVLHVALAAVIALVVAGLCISNFLRNPSALLDFLRGMGNYATRAVTGDSNTHGTQAHLHPWYFYVQRLGWFREHPAFTWSEGLILLLGLIGAGVALVRRPLQPFAAFIACYTVLLTVAFTVIPYKTPWNALPFLHGWILLAAIGLIAIDDAMPNRAMRHVVATLFGVGCIHLGWQAYRANFVYPADARNPYVYAGTSTDLLNMTRQIEDIAAVSGDRHALHIDVIAPGSDYWPLPWYLRQYPNTGYFSSIPDGHDAPVVISSADLDDDLKSKLDGYGSSYFGLRPGILFRVYVQPDLWQAFLRVRQTHHNEGT